MAELAAQPNPALMSALLTAVADNLKDLSDQVALLNNVPVMDLSPQLQQLVLAVNQLTVRVNDNHQDLVRRLDNIHTTLALQPMQLANSSAGPNGLLVGPNLAPLADPHPQTCEVLLKFTIAQCQASTAAFIADGYILQVHPNGTHLVIHQQQLALFLGVCV